LPEPPCVHQTVMMILRQTPELRGALHMLSLPSMISPIL
jgi:hypothetical protein